MKEEKARASQASSCTPGVFDASNAIGRNLAGVKHKLMVMSGKGGVGKSTVAVNLAFGLARGGKRVGLLDADIHGPSVPRLLGLPNLPLTVNDKGQIQPVTVPPGLKVVSIAFLLRDRDAPVIWRGPVKMGAIKQFLEEVDWGDLDYLVVDLPPGTGDEPLSIAQLVPSPDGAVIVTTPQDVALLSVRKSITFAKTMHLPLVGLVENMGTFTCPHCGRQTAVFEGNGVAKTTKDLGIPLLGTLPLSLEIARSGDEGRPFSGADNGASKTFSVITERIVASVEKRTGA